MNAQQFGQYYNLTNGNLDERFILAVDEIWQGDYNSQTKSKIVHYDHDGMSKWFAVDMERYQDMDGEWEYEPEEFREVKPVEKVIIEFQTI